MESTECTNECLLQDESTSVVGLKNQLKNQTKLSDNEEQGIPGFLAIQCDGSVARSSILFPDVDACEASGDGVACKDVVVDSDIGLTARIFVPRRQMHEEQCSFHEKLPVTLFVHGGGFCMFSVSSIIFQVFCKKMARKANTLVVSINYRLAPEHRLPTAYNDCFHLIKWLQSQAKQEDRSTVDPWLDCYADFSRCFWFGHSAGANIVHHSALRVATDDLRPLQVKGIILCQPFFGSETRTISEIELDTDESVIPVALSNEFWKFALPLGANRDHPYSNPMNEMMPPLSKIHLPHMLVVVGGRDPLKDRQIAYINQLQEAGKNVELLYFEEGLHGIAFFPVQETHAAVLLKSVVGFMHCHSKQTEPPNS